MRRMRAVLARYRRTGGDDRDIHPEMMEHTLVGSDIMPAATHLTAISAVEHASERDVPEHFDRPPCPMVSGLKIPRGRLRSGPST